MEKYERFVLILMKVWVACIELSLQVTLSFFVNDLWVKVSHCH